MHPYLVDTEFASQRLVELIGHEEVARREYQGLALHKEAEADFFHWDFTTADMEEDFDEHYVMNRFGRFASASEARDDALVEVARLKKTIDHKQKSLESLSGALLQLAKQGISIAFPGSANQSLAVCPAGRLIGSQSVRDVIWQGRNQTMHYDDPNPYHPPVTACFTILEADHGPEFALAKNVNFAFRLVLLLGWIDWKVFARDMVSLIG